MQINKAIEVLRIAGVALGFSVAFQSPGDPARAFGLLSLFLVVSLAGLTGIEGLFFGAGAARRSGYQDGGAYQRQSAINNLALAAVAVVVYVRQWGVRAAAAVCLVLLIFLTLSAVNHLYSALREGNRSANGLLRPLGTTALLITVIPFLVRALAAHD